LTSLLNDAPEWLDRAEEARRVARRISVKAIGQSAKDDHDRSVRWSAPSNWTRGAAANSDDLNLISSPAVATAYGSHWRQGLAVSAPYVVRENWCRASKRPALADQADRLLAPPTKPSTL